MLMAKHKVLAVIAILSALLLVSCTELPQAGETVTETKGEVSQETSSPEGDTADTQSAESSQDESKSEEAGEGDGEIDGEIDGEDEREDQSESDTTPPEAGSSDPDALETDGDNRPTLPIRPI